MTDVGRHISEGKMELSKSVLKLVLNMKKMKLNLASYHTQKYHPDEDLNMKYKTINFQKKIKQNILTTLECGEIS